MLCYSSSHSRRGEERTLLHLGADVVRSMWSGSPEQDTKEAATQRGELSFLVCGAAAARNFRTKLTGRRKAQLERPGSERYGERAELHDGTGAAQGELCSPSLHSRREYHTHDASGDEQQRARCGASGSDGRSLPTDEGNERCTRVASTAEAARSTAEVDAARRSRGVRSCGKAWERRYRAGKPALRTEARRRGNKAASDTEEGGCTSFPICTR